jgi:hypothetical protein
MEIIGTNDNQSYAISVADGRTDAVQRVYTGGKSDVADSAILYEYTYNQGSWTRRLIDKPQGNLVLGMAAGPGRDDDVVRIYAGCTNEASLYEYTWRDGQWLREVCGSPTTKGYHDVVIAPGRNDDSLRLYVGGLNGSVFEFTYRADAVIRVEPDSAIATDPAVTAIYDLYVINLGLRDDVIDMEITNTLPGWSARLTDINGNSLTDTDGDNTPDVGSVRRKDSVELRLEIISPQDAQPGTVDSTRVWGISTNVPGVADSALLLTSILEDTTTTPTLPPPDIHNFPNPFSGSTTFIYSIPQQGLATLGIYNRAGEHIVTLFEDEPHEPGIHTWPWDGANAKGESVAPGVYLYTLTFKPNDGNAQKIIKKALMQP